jgi:DUF1680 family protein
MASSIGRQTIPILAAFVLLFTGYVYGSGRGITNTTSSPYVKLRSVDIDDVRWTEGFWADRFAVCRTAMISSLKQALENPENAAYLDNFRVAAGLKKDSHRGTNWGDGDCYKFLETLAYVYAVTKDRQLDVLLDEWIEIIGQAQDSDGYISTNIQLNDKKQRWQNRSHHELYNHGHLLTAACIHYRATGKRSLLKIAEKLADYLYSLFSPRPAELAHWGWNPSNIMGLVELYRTTGNSRYLDLAGIFVDMRGSAPGGSDQNQFRIPLRRETKAVGHAVTAMYLYCGAADVYAETGEMALRRALERIWDDTVLRKMCITGAVGAITRGRSERGDDIHEAFGPDYFLPPRTSYNETCANIGNGMWNWRMLSLTGEAEYADILERVVYNSLLSATDIAGENFFYCNPLEWNNNREGLHPRHHTPVRWSIHGCYCCPPSVARTMAKLHAWVYSLSDQGIWINLYSGSVLNTEIRSGSRVRLRQDTDYPWNGRIRITFEETPGHEFAIMLRIPGWARGEVVPGDLYRFVDNVEAKPSLKVNNEEIQLQKRKGFICLRRTWSKGDTIELDLPMPVRRVAANDKVEACRGRVALQRGPLVYCAEWPDQAGHRVLNLILDDDTPLVSQWRSDLLGGIMALQGRANALQEDGALREQTFTAIPYYAWANRGPGEMAVWLARNRKALSRNKDAKKIK